MTAGYSSRPLIQKLGIKGGQRLALLHAPEHYLELLGALPADVTIDHAISRSDYDFIHAFYVRRAVFEVELERLKAAIQPHGMIWISWYKKAAKMPTDISENIVRDLALAAGLVDVKVAAIDAQWSGLKLVYRLKDR